jgi:PAS domain S-box-containing protein
MGSGNNNLAGGVAINSPDTIDRVITEENPPDAIDLLAAVVRASPQAVVMIDQNGLIKMWNSAAVRMFGWTEMDVLDLPNPLTTLSGTDGRDSVFANIMAGVEFTAAEQEMVRRDGSAIPVNLSSSPIRDFSGKIQGAVAILDDLTERKESERALLASEQRFSKAFNFSLRPMAINAIEDGKFISVNARLLEKLGVSAEEIVGKTPLDLGIDSAVEDKERVLGAIEGAGSLPPTPVELLINGSEPRMVLVSGEMIDFDGKRCLMSAFEDITAKRRAEAEQARLRAEVEKAALEWRLTFDAVDYQILLLDLSGRVLRLNRLAKETSGKGYWQIKGKPVESIGSGQPWQKAAELTQSVARSRTSFSCRIWDAATAKTWDLTASLVAAVGAGERIMMVARDITATVELQESLRKSETMSAMGALVAGVAHEVRNPLFSISATLDAFEARFGEKGTHRPYVSVLRGELDRLNQLMQDLLEYGRPSVLETSKRSIKDAVTQAVVSCATLANSAGVRIVERIDNGLSPVIMDRRRIIQVFHNLIANGIQHSRAGQTVTIEASREIRNDNVWIGCAVSDSGPGFASEEITRVFEPFFTKRPGGTGLGLSIVQRIVEEHGGTVVAGNHPSGGAVVKVSFKGVEE